MHSNRLTVGELVTMDPRFDEPGTGKITKRLSNDCVMVQWLTGDKDQTIEHPANIFRLHSDFDSDRKMVPFDIVALVGL